MFGLLWIVILAAGLAPVLFARSSRDDDQLEQPGAGLRRSRRLRRLPLAAAAVLVVIAANVLLGVSSDHFWFQALGLQSRFWTEMEAKALLFAIGAGLVFIATYACSSHLLARQLRTWRRVSVVIGMAVAVVLGLWALGMWERYLLFAHAAPTSVTDPIFGRPVGFYLFALPFYSALLSWVAGSAVVLIAVVGVLSTMLSQRAGAAPAAAAPAAQEAAGGSDSNADAPATGDAGDASGTDDATGATGAASDASGGVSGASSPGGAGATGAAGGSSRRLPAAAGPLLALGAVLLFALAATSYLSVFRLVQSESGVVSGADYTDVMVRRPARIIAAVALAAAAGTLLATAVVPALRRQLAGSGRRWLLVGGVTGLTVVLLSNAIAPLLVSSLVVRPNELTRERPYLQHNIDLTRRAYAIGADRVTERRLPVTRRVTAEVVDANRATLDNVRLWDWRALIDNLREQQEIRLYYQFVDVDIDRYEVDGQYRQMMLALRELDKAQLDPRSQTWVSRHFIYTHGYGMVMLPAHEIGPGGKPPLLIRSIPPESAEERLQIRRPEIYYGPTSTDHVYVNTGRQEFDYPLGEENVQVTYAGNGGVPMGGWYRRLALAWRFDGHRQLLSGNITGQSRIMFRRTVADRLNAIAPFLTLDADPYAVLTDDGRIVYIADAYTVSGEYPYAERYQGMVAHLRGINYIRNSVKAVIDAYDGSTTLYVIEPDDPIVQTYRRVFPELFADLETMPAGLQRHLRYPLDLMQVQAQMYGTYHMRNVDTFYQREDVWTFATERYRASFQPVHPYYVMVQFPGESGAEFVLMLPFTPRNKNVINAWMAGRSDMPNYGELVVYTFPKGEEILGPRQIEARIDQNTEMSEAMTLWGQRGSQVLRGNLLAIPLFAGEALHLLYVEPIYLEAQDARLPEVKRIAVADHERVVWAEDFSTSLDRLLGRAPRGAAAASGDGRSGAGAGGRSATTATADAASAERALQALRAYQQLVGDGQFAAAGERLEELRAALQALGG